MARHHRSVSKGNWHLAVGWFGVATGRVHPRLLSPAFAKGASRGR